MLSLTLKFVSALLLCLFWDVRESSALSCLPCEREKCVTPTNCKGGLVYDLCGCCHVCAKVKGEECGGPFNLAGRCDEGLTCHKNELDFNARGVCKCVALTCDIHCRHGHILDKNGCKTCKCHKYPRCHVSQHRFHQCYHHRPTVFCTRSCHSCCRHTTSCFPNIHYKRTLAHCKHHRYHSN